MRLHVTQQRRVRDLRLLRHLRERQQPLASVTAPDSPCSFARTAATTPPVRGRRSRTSRRLARTAATARTGRRRRRVLARATPARQILFAQRLEHRQRVLRVALRAPFPHRWYAIAVTLLVLLKRRHRKLGALGHLG